MLSASVLVKTHTAADRIQKLKAAHTEASKEIEDYKKAKEAEFRAFEASVSVLSR